MEKTQKSEYRRRLRTPPLSGDASARSKITAISFIFSIFALGFFSAYFAGYSISQSIEQPFSFSSNTVPVSPADFVKEDNILVYENKVVIEIDNASLSRYGPTGSMLPVFDEGANGIRVKVTSPDEIKLGDIITYERNGELIVHRVIEKGTDDEGLYFIVKGDNNLYSDGKIRFESIKYKTIGILY